jgi:SAM-dependent methyltransferase
MNVNLNAYEGVESLSRFSDEDFKRYCTDKLASVEKHIHFIKKHVIHSGYQGRVLEIGSGNGKLLFRLEQEGLLEKGFGYEVSQSRCLFAEKFKNHVNSKKVEIVNENFLQAGIMQGGVDLVIGIDIVINLIGGVGTNLIDNCIHQAKENINQGTIIFEFETFESECVAIRNSESGIFKTWKQFPDSDPFIYGLDELSENSGVINWKKHFIPRDKNVDHEHFEHDLLPTCLDFFKKKGFQIFDQWVDGDDTVEQEHVAFLKIE